MKSLSGACFPPRCGPYHTRVGLYHTPLRVSHALYRHSIKLLTTEAVSHVGIINGLIILSHYRIDPLRLIIHSLGAVPLYRPTSLGITYSGLDGPDQCRSDKPGLFWAIIHEYYAISTRGPALYQGNHPADTSAVCPFT